MDYGVPMWFQQRVGRSTAGNHLDARWMLQLKGVGMVLRRQVGVSDQQQGGGSSMFALA